MKFEEREKWPAMSEERRRGFARAPGKALLVWVVTWLSEPKVERHFSSVDRIRNGPSRLKFGDFFELWSQSWRIVTCCSDSWLQYGQLSRSPSTSEQSILYFIY